MPALRVCLAATGRVERLVDVAHELLEPLGLFRQAVPFLGHVDQARTAIVRAGFFRHLHAGLGKFAELLGTGHCATLLLVRD